MIKKERGKLQHEITKHDKKLYKMQKTKKTDQNVPRVENYHTIPEIRKT